MQDSPGDEGDIFSRLVQSQSISNKELSSLKSENDGKFITVNGQEIFIEQNTFQSAISSSPVGAGFTKNNGGWTNNNDYPRMLADVNGDGRTDIVGFGASSVFVSLSNGNGTFQNAVSSSPVGAGFTKNNGGWTNNNDYPRMLADVNGDGRTDIVGFAASSVFVSLSNGNGTFQNAVSSSPVGAGFTKNNGGWTNNNDYPRMLADVNGDGKADIVGLGASSVFVSLSNGNGTFQNAVSSSPVGAGFTKNNGGWTNNNDYPRMLADVNGDGKADIVGLGASSVFVSLSNGNGTFQNAVSSSPVGAGFTKNNGGWTNNNDYPRMLADANGDGKADIVGFAASSVFVSLSNGNGTFQNAVSSSPVGAGFTQNNGGWTNNNDYPRMLADVNGDKKADIVGFAANQVLTSFGVTSVAPPVYNSPNRLSQLLNKSTPLTIQEIQESRTLIGQRPDSERGNLYSQLQYKTPYFNQRDNGYKDIADVMCNVTTLANCLTSLGVQNPNSSKQFEDVLEDRLRNDPNKYPSSNGTNARYWWSNLSNLAESFGVRSSGTKSLQGFSSSDTKFFQDFVRNNWESGLRQGKAVMAGVYTTQPGHIIRVVGVDWQRGGLVIDDPYGRAQDTAGSDYKRNNYNRSGISNTSNTSSRNNINTQQGQDEAGNGKQNFWSWSYCAEVFGNTWYLILG
ncbi:FG-GAP-like repeat-containing protein [Nostoc sp.]|uniref:FG-GAP-like repeat-containing protein n=1 Tax=Nostoc sp. TaxID=1180 RepID=UPI002FFD4DAA